MRLVAALCEAGGAAEGEHARPDLQDAVTVAILGRELAVAGAGER